MFFVASRNGRGGWSYSRYYDDIAPANRPLGSQWFALKDGEPIMSNDELASIYLGIEMPPPAIEPQPDLPPEPTFTLRAQDLLAPLIIRLWAEAAEHHGSPLAKTNEARDIATAMKRWQTDTGRGKYPD